MSNNALIIFIRNPKIGKVKTRLAKTIGNDASLKIYELLLQHTFEITQHIDSDKIVYYSEEVEKEDLWDNTYQKAVQIGDDLGAKMYNAFSTAFLNRYENVIIIGSDAYDLTAAHLQEAFKMMNTHDVVIGPAKDGGYYLLGMKILHSQIFENKPWGTSTVYAKTMQDLKGFKVHALEPLNDIDVYEDIIPIQAFQQFLKT